MMKNMKKLFCLVLAVAMLLSVMAGCASKAETSTAASETTESASSETASTESGETAATDGEITIAFIGNTTGDYAQYGIPVRNAVMMYFDQLNAAGGINGKTVKDANGYTDTATLKFHSSSLLPIHLHLGFVVTDTNGKSYLIGSKEAPYPKLNVELGVGDCDGDGAGYYYEITHVAIKSIVACLP